MGRTSFYRITRIVVLIASLLIIISLFSFSGQDIFRSGASASLRPPVNINEGWQYRLGDSPVDSAGVPLWSLDSSNSSGWKAYDSSKPPRDRAGYKIMWKRVKIPELSWEDPCLYIPTDYQTFEVYTDGSLIYKFGEIDPFGVEKFPNYSWNIIPLKSNYAGKFLYFRVYSHESEYLGNFNHIQLSSPREVLTSVIKNNVYQLILAFFFTMLGLFIVIIFFLRKGSEKAFISLGFFCVCAGVCLISASKMNCFLLDAPTTLFYISTISMCLIPIGIISFVEQVFDCKSKRIYLIFRHIYIFYLVLLLTFDFLNLVPIYLALNVFYMIWVITTPILVIAPLKKAFEGDLNAKIYTWGVAFLLLSAFYDILGGSLRLIPWPQSIFVWGMFAFVISMLLIIAHRFFDVHDKLKVYFSEIEVKNVTLSKMWEEVKESRDAVTERNEALEERSQELEGVNSELLILLDTLQNTQAQLVQSEKMAALGSLVAGIAHEINTPIGIGVTAASYIERKTQEFIDLYNTNKMKKSDLENYLSACSETTSMILSNLQRSSDLVRSFKQIASDQYNEESRKFNVKEYLYEALTSLRPELKKTKHNVTINCPDELVINSYPGALYQVLTNLIMNSLIHAYDEGSTGNISILIQKQDGIMLLKYQDDGKGVDSETIDKIFDPFFTTRRGKGGTGLGLHIVYNIATQTLGGSIKCESTPGKGTSFIITCPLKEDLLHE